MRMARRNCLISLSRRRRKCRLKVCGWPNKKSKSAEHSIGVNILGIKAKTAIVISDTTSISNSRAVLVFITKTFDTMTRCMVAQMGTGMLAVASISINFWINRVCTQAKTDSC